MELKKTPFLKIKTIKVDIQRTPHPAGGVILKSTIPIKKRPHRMTQRLLHWAKKTPDKVFIGQRLPLPPDPQPPDPLKGESDPLSPFRESGGKKSSPFRGLGGQELKAWRTLTYAETLKKVESIAHFLLKSKVSPERPIAILSENSIEHGLMALAALHIGVPYCSIAPAYSLRSTDYDKLRHTINLLTPGLIFVQSGQMYDNAIKAVAPEVEVVAVSDPLSYHTLFEDISNIELKQADSLKIKKAFNNIKPESVAKILFTSGSTGLPKGVINTHGNITTNWQQITQTFPFMRDGGLTFIDWLPWNHTFGGNHNFGLTVYNGGTLYIDEGNPTPHGIHKTVENLHEISPSMYCNVPKGFEELIPFLKNDTNLREKFFKNLKLLFYAGAGMPQHVWDELEALAYQTTGKRILISTGLGMTETSPSSMFNVHFGSFSGMLGVPVAGMELKLVPNGGKLEARFRAPNVMPGYWRNAEATAKAFDEEGFYCTGDALKYVDENDPNKGMIFDGRIAEDFKLDTGTWVSVGVLKAKLITAGKGLIQDAVITGHDKPFVGAIIFPELNYCKKLAGLSADADLKTVVNTPSVIAALQDILNTFARQSTGSSTLIKRAVFADFSLSIDKGEITDKGSINQRAIIANQPEYVSLIYQKELVAPVLEVKK